MASVLPTGVSLLRPLVALGLWTFGVEGAMTFYRTRAIIKHNIQFRPETAREGLNKIPERDRWPADNYNNLHEQPTVFYAVILALVQMGAGDDGLLNKMAWGYVGLRFMHSLVQCSVNAVETRFFIFLMSSLVLFGITGRAAQMLL